MLENTQLYWLYDTVTKHWVIYIYITNETFCVSGMLFIYYTVHTGVKLSEPNLLRL